MPQRKRARPPSFGLYASPRPDDPPSLSHAPPGLPACEPPPPALPLPRGDLPRLTRPALPHFSPPAAAEDAEEWWLDGDAVPHLAAARAAGHAAAAAATLDGTRREAMPWRAALPQELLPLLQLHAAVHWPLPMLPEAAMRARAAPPCPRPPATARADLPPRPRREGVGAGGVAKVDCRRQGGQTSRPEARGAAASPRAPRVHRLAVVSCSVGMPARAVCEAAAPAVPPYEARHLTVEQWRRHAALTEANESSARGHAVRAPGGGSEGGGGVCVCGVLQFGGEGPLFVASGGGGGATAQRSVRRAAQAAPAAEDEPAGAGEEARSGRAHGTALGRTAPAQLEAEQKQHAAAATDPVGEGQRRRASRRGDPSPAQTGQLFDSRGAAQPWTPHADSQRSPTPPRSEYQLAAAAAEREPEPEPSLEGSAPTTAESMPAKEQLQEERGSSSRSVDRSVVSEEKGEQRDREGAIAGSASLVFPMLDEPPDSAHAPALLEPDDDVVDAKDAEAAEDAEEVGGAAEAEEVGAAEDAEEVGEAADAQKVGEAEVLVVEPPEEESVPPLPRAGSSSGGEAADLSFHEQSSGSLQDLDTSEAKQLAASMASQLAAVREGMGRVRENVDALWGDLREELESGGFSGPPDKLSLADVAESSILSTVRRIVEDDVGVKESFRRLDFGGKSTPATPATPSEAAKPPDSPRPLDPAPKSPDPSPKPPQSPPPQSPPPQSQTPQAAPPEKRELTLVKADSLPRLPSPPPALPEYDPLTDCPEIQEIADLLEEAEGAAVLQDYQLAVGSLGRILSPGRFAAAIAAAAAREAAAGGRLSRRDAQKRAEVRSAFLAEIAYKAHKLRAQLLQRLHLLAPALLDLSALIDMKPADDELKKLLLERALLLTRLDRLDEAMRDLEPLIASPPSLSADGELTSVLAVPAGANGAMAISMDAVVGEGLKLRLDSAAEAMELRAKLFVRKRLQLAALAAYEELVRVYPKKPSLYIALADLRAERGEIELELSALRSASLMQPTNVPLAKRVAASYEKAISLGATDKIPQGILHMSQLIERGAGTEVQVLRAKMRVALANLLSGDEDRSSLYVGATSDLTLAIKQNPQHGEALLFRGCLEAKSNRKRAVEDLHLASSLLSNDPRGPMARGIIFESLGDSKNALLEYQEAAKRTHRAFPLLAISLIYFNFFRQVPTALYYCARAVALEPTYIRARMVLAVIHLHNDNGREALLAVTQGLHMAPSNNVLLALQAECFLRLRLASEAAAPCWSLARSWETAAHDRPLVVLQLQLLAECSLVLGRPADAVQLMTQATGLMRPPHALSLSLLGVAQHCNSQLHEAEATFKRAGTLLGGLEAEELALFYVRRGHLELALDDVPNAIRSYEEAIASSPGSTIAKEGLAWAQHYLLDGTYDAKRERKAYTELWKQHPSLLRARLHHAHLMWRQGQLLATSCQLGLIVETDSTPAYCAAVAHVFRAIAHCRGRRYGSAVQEAEAALKLKPVSYLERLARFARGSCLCVVGEYATAYTDLKFVAGSVSREAALLSSNSPESAAVRQLALCTHFNLGIALWFLAQPAKAFEAFADAQRFGRDLRQRKTKAKVDPPNAMRVGEVAPLRSQSLASAHLATAVSLQRLVRLKESSVQYQIAERLDKCCMAALLGHGHLLFEEKDFQGAMRAYARAAVMQPTSPKPRVAIARLYHHQGNQVAALRALEAAFALNPRDSEALEARAAIFVGQHKIREAFEDLHAALCVRNAPEPGMLKWKELLCSRALVSAQLGNIANAVRDLSDAICAPLSHARSLGSLGSLQLQHRNWTGAAALFEKALSLLEDEESRASLEGIPPDVIAAMPTSLDQSRDEETSDSDDDADEVAETVEQEPELSVKEEDERKARAAQMNRRKRGNGFASVDLGTFQKVQNGTLHRAAALRGRAALGAGIAHIMAGNAEQAQMRLDEAVSLRPRCGRTVFNRSVFYMRLQDWEKAERDLRECVKLIPGFAEAWLRKSDAVHAQQNGRRREILMDYANALAVMDYLAESSSQKAAKNAAKLAKLTIGEDGQLSAKCQ
ncbi:hypothetical protein AB1Y20_006992 [Prymnesium parvum]|uniref:Uncharacterized protein n=1 Tax=Prymnesium parvum TaxID=97485 RepID=A0AB34J398_PRYPA